MAPQDKQGHSLEQWASWGKCCLGKRLRPAIAPAPASVWELCRHGQNVKAAAGRPSLTRHDIAAALLSTTLSVGA